MSQSLLLHAPLAGWAALLEEAPDPVFASRMMGHGVVIDPVGGALVAPCAATVVKVHAARHAVTLRTAQGAEILLHIGIDTVALAGEGFTAHVQDGDRVELGQTLVSFDLDRLTQAARSLISPVLVTNPERFEVEILAADREVAAGEPLLRLTGRTAANSPAAETAPRASRQVQLTHPHGLHARPAGLIAAEARRWNAVSEMAIGDRRANAASSVSLMALGATAGDTIQIAAVGTDAETAVTALAATVARINAAPMAEAMAAPVRPGVASAGTSAEGVIQGVAAAPGLAIGPAWRLQLPEPPHEAAAGAPPEEAAILRQAIAAAAAGLEDRMKRLAGEGRGVVAAHLSLLQDPDLVGAAEQALGDGLSAGTAWRQAIDEAVRTLQGSKDARLAERALDLVDLERRVLWAIAGSSPDTPRPPPGAILLTDDLMPSDLAELEGAGLAGLCTVRGGPTSHVAVLAAAMGIPAVVAAGPAVQGLPDAGTLVLDGDAGRLEPNPAPDRIEAVEREIAARIRRDDFARAGAAEPAHLTDGARIEVLANLGSLADAESAVRNGADGCGLLRTEFLFLDRATPPSEAEQAQAYQAIAHALAGRPVVVRTLDVGGDKPAPYLDLPTEENPALGVRGVRVGLRRPALLREQLRAILSVQPEGQCRIMVPMVASVAELVAVRALLDAAAADLGRAAPTQLGVMVETPAAAATADLIAETADFISIGTNDLTQYALAMDRGNPALASEVDGMHPAILRLIRLAAEGAARFDRPVSVCGGLASDPAAVAILVGLGVGELSVTPSRVAATKALIRTLDMTACRTLAMLACDLTSAAAVRDLSAAAMA